MDISSIIYAALGGGLGAGLGSLIGYVLGRSQKSKSILVSGFAAGLAVLGFTVSGALYKNMTLPRIIPMDANELDASVSYLKYIRKENPQAYAEMIRPIDKAVRNNTTSQEMFDEFRATLTRVLTEKKREASAETLRGEFDVAIELYVLLKEDAPIVCTQKLHGRPFQDMSELLSDDYTEKEQRALSAFFTSPPRDRNFNVDLKQGETLFNSLLQDSLTSLEILDADPSVSVSSVENLALHKKICDFHIKFNSDLMALDDTSLINTTQFIATQQG